MVYVLTSTIKFHNRKGFGRVEITNPISVEIEKNIKNEENFCTIVVSKNIFGTIDRLGNGETFGGIFHDFGAVKGVNGESMELGSFVEVSLGYNRADAEYFSGFINNINLDGDFVTIRVQDYSYILKKLVLDMDTKTRTLKEIGDFIIEKANEYLLNNYSGFLYNNGGFGDQVFSTSPVTPEPIDINYVFPDFKIHNFKLSKANGLDVLKYLRDKFIIDSFMSSNIIYLNYALDQKAFDSWNEKNTKVFTLVSDRFLKGADVLLEEGVDKNNFVKELPTGYNYILSTQNLKYQYGEEILRKYIIKSISPRTGKEVKVEVGNDGGDKHTIVLIPDKDEYTEDDLRKMYKQLELKYTYTGFKKGSTFTTYGMPVINLYEPVAFVGVGFKDESNTPYQISQANAYLVTGKKVTFGEGGFRQEVEIGIKLQLSGDIFNEDVFFQGDGNKLKGTDLNIFDGTQKLFLE